MSINLQPLTLGQVMRSRVKEINTDMDKDTTLTFANQGDKEIQIKSKEKRGVSSMSKFIDTVIHEIIIPIATSNTNPEFTIFTFTEQDTLNDIIENSVSKDCPNLMKSKKSFMDAAADAYDNILRTRESK